MCVSVVGAVGVVAVVAVSVVPVVSVVGVVVVSVVQDNSVLNGKSWTSRRSLFRCRTATGPCVKDSAMTLPSMLAVGSQFRLALGA